MSLEVSDLSSGYGMVEILHSVTLRAEKGKVTGIIGPNGSGKSTLLKSIFGVLKVSSGKVLYGDEEITGWAPHRLTEMGISYLMQRRSVFPYLTVMENLKMGAWGVRRDPARVERAIMNALERFPRLKERKYQKSGSLSGGEQRMLELARALITEPQFLLIDEFSTGLSPVIFKALYEELKALNEEGLTILAVDQNVRELLNVASYVYVLKMGRNHFEGTADDLNRDVNKVIRDWLVV